MAAEEAYEAEEVEWGGFCGLMVWQQEFTVIVRGRCMWLARPGDVRPQDYDTIVALLATYATSECNLGVLCSVPDRILT